MTDPAHALVKADGTPIHVMDVNNSPVPITALWSKHTAILIFVRHFLCTECQVSITPPHSIGTAYLPDTSSSSTAELIVARLWCAAGALCWQDYFKEAWTAYTTHFSSSNPTAPPHFNVIGCGSPKLAQSLAIDIGAYAHPHFHIYTDQDRVAYQALGLVYKSQFDCGLCVRGTVRALWQGVSRCWCICESGDIKQNGGEFVLEGGTGRCLLAHVDQKPGGHAAVEDVLKAAGMVKK